MIQSSVSSVSSDLLIEQNQELSHSAPAWLYAPPTPQLQEKGLTPDVLQEIVDEINENAKRDYNENYYPNIGLILCLPIIGILTGAGIFVFGLIKVHTAPRLDGEWDGECNVYTVSGVIIVAISYLLCPLMVFIIGAFTNIEMKITMDNVREKVEKDLNEAYEKSNGISWSIQEEQTKVFVKEDHHIRTYIQQWYHIAVSPIGDISVLQEDSDSDDDHIINIQPDGCVVEHIPSPQ